jgi:nucleoside-diphosphate-sugar epimerase
VIQSDKVALVTGASRGIGAATAERLRGDGWRVDTAERASGVDLTEPGAGAAVVEGLDRIDALVCNAGTTTRSGILELEREEWDRVIAVNLNATFELAQAAARRMVEQGGGSIVMVASLMSFVGGFNIAPYQRLEGRCRPVGEGDVERARRTRRARERGRSGLHRDRPDRLDGGVAPPGGAAADPGRPLGHPGGCRRRDRVPPVR